MAEVFLTIKEIAKQLQVPESNIRYYRDRFDDFIPSVGEGRKRRYKEEALDVFEHIVSAYRNEKNTDQIAAELASAFPRAVHVDTGSGSERTYASSQLMSADQDKSPERLSYHVLQAQARTLEHLAQALARHNSLAAEFSRLREEQGRLKKGLVHIWRDRKAEAAKESGLKDGDLAALGERMEALEGRVAHLESTVCHELTNLRHELKECLDLTRDLVSWVGDDLFFSFAGGNGGGPADDDSEK